MTTFDWILNLTILAVMIFTVIGTRRVTAATFVRPLVIVCVVVTAFLRGVPTSGHDVALVLGFVGLGAVLGALSSAASRVLVREGRVMVQAGAAYALVWLVAVGFRVAFVELATHSERFGRWLVTFSVQHQITGADAWRAAFVLMSLTMVVTRVALVAWRAHSVRDRAALVPA
ncbi:hypothetical protein [Deinococcus pimensis]|uniref:hypothetical protein n=1 Tax=Deinococcus pimensis TaxID=309888 RepID=UPI0004AC9033|nr:hypothetical protein [Deinococcus pimensis]